VSHVKSFNVANFLNGTSTAHRVAAVAVMLCALVFFRRRPRKLSGAGKTVLVSGCDSGFGQMLTHDLSVKEGCKVLAGCLTQAGVDQWKGKENVVPFLLDITDEKSIERAGALVAENCPDGLWGLVNNAGTNTGLLFELTPVTYYRKLFEINFFGHIALTQKVLPYLKKARGRLVNMASAAGIMPLPLASAYSSSKHAMVGWTLSIIDELAPYGISVSVLQPGFMKTPLVTREHQEKTFKEFRSLMSEEDVKIFEPVFKSMADNITKLSNRAGNPQLVVDTYKNALLSTKPKDIYIVGNDAIIFRFLHLYSPKWFRKAVQSLVVSPPPIKGIQ